MKTPTQGNWYARAGVNQMVSDDTTICSLSRSNEKQEGNWFIFSDAETHGDGEADARLMAASPALLAALIEVTPALPPENAPCHMGICAQSACGHCGRIYRAIQAIAKATGYVK